MQECGGFYFTLKMLSIGVRHITKVTKIAIHHKPAN
uniref:Uncharacterized protein n=1 Tax=Arundo donax TaxID=35708 RepID=A0A0A9FMD4_ARUDO